MVGAGKAPGKICRVASGYSARASGPHLAVSILAPRRWGQPWAPSPRLHRKQRCVENEREQGLGLRKLAVGTRQNICGLHLLDSRFAGTVRAPCSMRVCAP